MSLSKAQIQAIDITEKICSAFSVFGELFVILTFLLSSKFRKPINRLVFYATWGNILTSVATLIGRSGLKLGLDSGLCQFQAFLIQWFMPADALWTFAMACNVWLSFFRHYDAQMLRSLEWKYLLFCYGIPFPPALIFRFLATNTLGRVYGDAVLWCWVSIDWDFLRVAVFYAPVWIVILLTISIYIRVGAVIWKWRRQLKSLGEHSNQQREIGRPRAHTTTPVSGIRRTDEFTVVRGVVVENTLSTQFGSPLPSFPPSSVSTQSSSPYSHDRTTTRNSRTRSRSRGTFSSASRQANKATIKYCKCALLFFITLLITWVPSSINRIYTLLYPDDIIFGLQFAAALVLPLQGFWNAVIYIATSVYACRCLWQEILVACGVRRPETELIHMRRDLRSLSFDSRREWRGESDKSSLKPTHLTKAG